MQSFLETIADKILSLGMSMEEMVLVFPSRRSKRYFSKALSEKITSPILPPALFSVEDFVQELSGMQPAKATALQFHFYEVYCKTLPEGKRQNFETYLNWAPLLLKDFNDLDAHLAPINDVFDYLNSLEDIKSWAKEEDQRSTIITNYLDFWKQAPELYHALYAHLMQHQIGYLGMLFREAVANLEFYLDQNTKHQIFIGFNALNKAEAFIIQEILDANQGQCFWDIDRAFYADKQHRAGTFIRSYFKEWKSLRKQKAPDLYDCFSQSKTFHFVASSKRIAQAKYAAQQAVALYQKNPSQKIALVLSDESLLIPLLSGLPPDFEDYNITMGYPLSQAPQTGFFRELIRLHLNHNNSGFLFSDLRVLLHTPRTKEFLIKAVPAWEAFYEKLEKQHRSVVPSNEILALDTNNQVLDLLFGTFSSAAAMLPRLQVLCSVLLEYLKELKHQNTFWEQYCLQRFKALFEQIQGFNAVTQSMDQLSVVQKLLEEQLALETVDLSGTPISGIQILGVLETRLLDFDTVILTDVNEGVLPAGKKQQSFLPFEVKKNYGLPTFLEQDAIYTYHFYRLIQRAKEVYLLYNSTGSGLQTGEPSRFLAQLELLPQAQHTILHKVLHNSISFASQETLQLPKSEGVMERLKAWAAHGVSPSALTTYLRAPFDFYDRYVLQLKQPQPWSLVMEPRESGTLLHDVLETLYAPYLNSVLTVSMVEDMSQNFETLLEEKYQQFHQGNAEKQGKNHLIFEALKVYGKALLEFEKKQIKEGHKIEILALEQQVNCQLTLPSDGTVVKLKGVIDRIDRMDGELRIIDYKTGKVEASDLKIKTWEAYLENTSSPAFQLLTYAFMYAQKEQLPIVGIYALQNTKAPFLPLQPPEYDTKQKQLEPLAQESLTQFSKALIQLLETIMNPNEVFSAPKK